MDGMDGEGMDGEGMDGEGMDGEGMDGTDAAPSFPTCCFLRSPQFLSCRKAAKREILLCDFEGCGKIFSNRQYLNVRAAVGQGLWGQDPFSMHTIASIPLPLSAAAT